MTTVDQYESMARNGVGHIDLPTFIRHGYYKSYCGGEFIFQAINIMQRKAGKATREALRRIKENDDRFWQDVKDEDKRYSESYKAKLRLTLLYKSLFAHRSSPVWNQSSLDKLLNEHLTHHHLLSEIEQNEKRLERLLRQESTRLNPEQPNTSYKDQHDDGEVLYHDLTTAMTHFREREREIERLDIAEEDKEMIRIRLAEKRSQVLDEFLDA